MKRIFLVSLISITVFSATGCSSKEEEGIVIEDRTSVKRIVVNGEMKKTHYALNEQWDLDGLYVNATLDTGDEVKLADTEYVFKINVATPAAYDSNFSVTAVFKIDEKSSLSNTKIISGISVDSPTYNESSEINSYYTNCNLTGTGSTLLKNLQTHTFEKHTSYIPYGNVSNFYKKGTNRESIDLMPNNSGNEAFYTGNVVPYTYGTREHVWACADSSGLWVHNGIGNNNVDSKSYIGGGSDLYHIRPVDSTINTLRGDAPFVDFDDIKRSYSSSTMQNGKYSIKVYPAGCTQYADLVEVDDNMKGDVARIIAYVYMHYNSNGGTVPSSYSYMVGNLYITSALGYSSASACFKKLVEWSNLDPVSATEKYRNHTVMGIQGNRNPFVDKPDLMTKVFNNL